MNPKSVEFLRDYNDWRRSVGRYSEDSALRECMPAPTKIGEAIDWACEQIERNSAWHNGQAVLVPCAELKAMQEQIKRMQKDAAIGRLVRSKLVSGNSIPVERCVIRASEVAEIDAEAITPTGETK